MGHQLATPQSGESIIFVLPKVSPISRSWTLGEPTSALTAALQMKASSFFMHRVRILLAAVVEATCALVINTICKQLSCLYLADRQPSGQTGSGNTTSASIASKKKKKKYAASDLTVQSWMEK